MTRYSVGLGALTLTQGYVGSIPIRATKESTVDKEQLIDQFLAKYGRESREYAKYYLEETNWNVDAAIDLYWRENILIY